MRRGEHPAAFIALLDVSHGDPDLVTTRALHSFVRHAGISPILVGSKSCENVRAAIEAILTTVDGALLKEAPSMARKTNALSP